MSLPSQVRNGGPSAQLLDFSVRASYSETKSYDMICNEGRRAKVRPCTESECRWLEALIVGNLWTPLSKQLSGLLQRKNDNRGVRYTHQRALQRGH